MKRLRVAAIRLSAALLAAAAVFCSTAEARARTQEQEQQAALARVNTALQAGEADKALDLLKSVAQSNASLAEAANLECRVRLTMEQWNAAAAACERAVRLDGQNSNYHLWLGRALGEKADRASFLSAFSLAKRTRAEFEESVRLNPRNAEALSDLGEFYEEAPSVVGGGTDKANAVAAQLDSLDAARADELRGRIAEQRKDYDAAERQFKQAVAVGAHPASHWISLASFYRRRKRWTEMESAVHSGATAAERDKHDSVALYDGALVLIEAHRNPELAAKMLGDYLAGPVKTEQGPAFAALTRLARLKSELGDPEAANRDQAAALALANGYKPVQDSNSRASGAR